MHGCARPSCSSPQEWGAAPRITQRHATALTKRRLSDESVPAQPGCTGGRRVRGMHAEVSACKVTSAWRASGIGPAAAAKPGHHHAGVAPSGPPEETSACVRGTSARERGPSSGLRIVESLCSSRTKKEKRIPQSSWISALPKKCAELVKCRSL